MFGRAAEVGGYSAAEMSPHDDPMFPAEVDCLEGLMAFVSVQQKQMWMLFCASRNLDEVFEPLHE